MSSRAGSTKKQNVPVNEANDTLYDPFVGFKPRENLVDIPWPEWNDADLNAEVWGEPKVKARTSTKQSVASTNVRLFEDPASYVLPKEFKDYIGSWKRPQELFPNAELTVFDPKNVWFSLKIPSVVGECEFLSRFMKILPILQYYGEQNLIPVEMESPTFAVSNPLEPWRPWHYIYSLNKAGKGAVHKPLMNPYGKYVLRLFYFGCWRKFIIDDKIPCDKYGNCMLPVTQVEGELWPLLLVKGLLKITSLTPSSDISTIDFSIMSCLTAYIDLRLTTLNKSYEEIWRRIVLLTPKFTLPEEPKEENSKNNPATKDSIKSKTAKLTQSVNGNVPSENFCFLFALLGGFPLDSSDLNGEFVLLTMNRDIPLVKAEKREPTKPWKRFRWVDWAAAKGLWVDELLLPPYRRLLYITFNKKFPALFAPDPTQELTMYNLSKEVVPNEEQNSVTEGSETPKPEYWLDYNKFYEYLAILNVMFRPSFFTSTFKVIYALPPVPGKVKGSSLSGKATAKAPLPPQNLYVYSPFITPTLNQPPLLFCECVTESILFINLWVHPQKIKSDLGYLDSQQPPFLKIGHASLVVEDCDWRNTVQGKIVGVVKTVGNCSMYLNLERGRHILKLWLSSDSPYVLNILSGIEVYVHRGPKVRLSMSNESKRILNYVSDISDSFIELTQKFGKEEYRECVLKFYKALKSGTSKSVNQLIFENQFIDLFLDSVMAELKNLMISYDELQIMLGALRSLFINLRITFDFAKPPTSVSNTDAKKEVKDLKKGGKSDRALVERSIPEALKHSWTPKELQQITMIQRIFRGYRLRLLFKCQTPARKEFKAYVEKLKKICELIFSPSKREIEVGKIIRQIIKVNPDLCNVFRFHDDFSQVLHVEEYMGKVPNVEAYAWVPLVKFTIALHSDEPEPCAFYLYCNLEQYFLVGVNNDTNEEIFILTHTISPHYYNKNVNGYTIFGYGWNGANPGPVHWRLEMVTMKWFQGVHLCNTLLGPECHPYSLPAVGLMELKNFYIPNRQFKICRCFIIVRKKCSVTLRFSSSYPKAKFQITIFLERKKRPKSQRHSLQVRNLSKQKYSVTSLVKESVSENGTVLIPSLTLENVETEFSGDAGESENSTKYILEAYVLEDSWPLTKHEWGVIEPVRMNGDLISQSSTFFLPKKDRSETTRRTSRVLKRPSAPERIVQNPFWQFQVVYSNTEGEAYNSVTIGEEKLFSESMTAMKKFWEDNDPGRRNKGREMRLNFLNSVYLENKSKQNSVHGKDMEEAKNYDELSASNVSESFFEDMIHKMNSFSYLLDSKSPTRYSQSPKVLPKMPMNELLKKYGRKNKYEISKHDLSIYEEHVEDNIDYEIEEKEREFWDERSHYRQVLANHFREVQNMCEQLIEEGYKQRQKALEKMAG